jgi:uncharacterized protein (TIGR03067 family)
METCTTSDTSLATWYRTMKFKLDPTKTPRQIDLEGNEIKRPGIYELNGNDLKICYDTKGIARPAQCKTEAGNETVMLLVLKRKS